jgi:hypothetical protein
MPAAKIPIPMRISEPAMTALIQWAGPIREIRERQGHQVIRNEAEQKSDEKQEGWSRNRACCFPVTPLLAD